jgi:DNA-binding NarL/FixJ family response regulator
VVAEGGSLFAPTVTRRLIEEFARRPRAMAPSGLEALTERESEVLRLVARGLSNTEIAGQLFVSENTVKTHVARVLMKLGLRDRVQAVVLAYETGLVQPS